MLDARWGDGKFLCVGLDPVEEKILKTAQIGGPRHEQFVLTFLERIVDATKDVAAAFKPNRAFYRGHKGAEELRKLIEHIHIEAPDVPVILDCKVGDIGASNEGYIEEAFDYFDADAMTVHSYLGCGTWNKALQRGDKGLIFLCRTSNPEAADLQDKKILVDFEELRDLTGLSYTNAIASYGWKSSYGQLAMPVYEYIALRVANLDNYNCGLVVGATAPEQLARVRLLAPDLPILIPGIGRQGGDLAASVKAAEDTFLINASSGILYAFEQRPDVNFAEAARLEAEHLHGEIQAALSSEEN